MTDNTRLLAVHEAGHAVAAYLLDCSIEKLEAWPADGRMIHPTPKTPEGHIDGFALAVISLAGEAFCDELGLTRLAENDHDKDNACRAILEELSENASRQTAQAALEVVEEATRELVKSERFASLAVDLAGKLTKEHLMLGSEVERFLRQRDPDRPSIERHSVGPRVSFVRHPIGPYHNRDCVVCKAYPPSAADWAAGENRGPAFA